MPEPSAESCQCWGKSELLKKLLLSGQMGNLEVGRRKYETGRKGPIPITSENEEMHFWSRVGYSALGCWEWKAGKNHDGYGSVWFRKRAQAAHRISWILTRGDITEGLNVLHKCDNPPCVRPDHLFLGTQPDNVHDMQKKGRLVAPRGEDRPNAALKEADVRAIREMAGRFTRAEIAAQFSVARSHVSAIILRKKWGWLQ